MDTQRLIAMDIETVQQYQSLASRCLNRTIASIHHAMLNADPERHVQLLHLQDQCKAQLKLIDHAYDAGTGIDTDFLQGEDETATKGRKKHEDQKEAEACIS